jgi:hypothetical protein
MRVGLDPPAPPTFDRHQVGSLSLGESWKILHVTGSAIALQACENGSETPSERRYDRRGDGPGTETAKADVTPSYKPINNLLVTFPRQNSNDAKRCRAALSDSADGSERKRSSESWLIESLTHRVDPSPYVIHSRVWERDLKVCQRLPFLSDSTAQDTKLVNTSCCAVHMQTLHTSHDHSPHAPSGVSQFCGHGATLWLTTSVLSRLDCHVTELSDARGTADGSGATGKSVAVLQRVLFPCHPGPLTPAGQITRH